MASKTPIFLRDATGLRKSLSPIDAFGLNLLTVNIGLGILFLAFLAPTSFPGGDMVLATLLTTLACIIFSLMWSFLAAAIPRLGGDYVYVSRLVHPLIGVISNWAVVIFGWLFDVVAIYLFTSDGLSPSLYALGYLTNNQGLIALGGSVSSTSSIFMIGLTIIVLSTLVILVSTRLFVKLLRIIWIGGILGTVALLTALLTVTPEGFVANMNAYASSVGGGSNYYSAILTSGSTGLVPIQSLSLNTILIIPIAFFSLGFFFYSSYVGVEIKNVQKAQIYGMILAVVVSGLFIAALAWAFEQTASYGFIYALTNVYFTNPSAYTLPAPPYINYLAMIGSGNIVLSILIMFGFLCWGITWYGLGTFLYPRNMMAWSFDQLGPGLLAKVHERFNTPHWGILVSFIGQFILFLLTFVTGSFILGLSAVAGNIIYTFIPMAIAAAIFPYRNRDLFERSPSIVKKKIGGFSLITILGIISLLFMIMNAYLFLANPLYGANSPASLEVIGGALVVAVLWYFIWKGYRSSKGVDVSLAFKQIPPE